MPTARNIVPAPTCLQQRTTARSIVSHHGSHRHGRSRGERGPNPSRRQLPPPSPPRRGGGGPPSASKGGGRGGCSWRCLLRGERRPSAQRAAWLGCSRSEGAARAVVGAHCPVAGGGWPGQRHSAGSGAPRLDPGGCGSLGSRFGAGRPGSLGRRPLWWFVVPLPRRVGGRRLRPLLPSSPWSPVAVPALDG
ncbi:hypothetical protein BRADI_1g03962v3 [Brachypodium distachyon]|uniref:Uncharacterized protein n=1 Tax=Brachypodium distachyon TaxID=15368 RepID=A0A0Q3N737_BRADI|nr:hypothetical protein BRADI_1g03962v3 [Brachypodium distachyon]